MAGRRVGTGPSSTMLRLPDSGRNAGGTTRRRCLPPPPVGGGGRPCSVSGNSGPFPTRRAHGSGLGTDRCAVKRTFARLHYFSRLRIRWEIRDAIAHVRSWRRSRPCCPRRSWACRSAPASGPAELPHGPDPRTRGAGSRGRRRLGHARRPRLRSTGQGSPARLDLARHLSTTRSSPHRGPGGRDGRPRSSHLNLVGRARRNSCLSEPLSWANTPSCCHFVKQP